MIFILLPKLYKTNVSNVGGGEISNLLLISSISKMDEVMVIPMLRSEYDDNLTLNNRVTVSNSKFKVLGRLGYFIQRYFLFDKRVISLTKKYKPSKIICTRSTITLGNKIKKASSCELEIIVRAYEDFNSGNKFDSYKKISLFRKIESTFIARRVNDAFVASNRIITNSNFMKKAIMEEFDIDKKCTVIFPEVDLKRKNPRFKSMQIAGFINRGIKKGSQIIIHLAQINPSIKFLIFGDQLDVSFSNIINMGYLADRSIIFDQIDVLLVPSLWYEPYGRVASEAIWSGIPALVSKIGGLIEAAPNSDFWVEDFTSISNWDTFLNGLNNDKEVVNQKILKAQSILAGYNHDYH
jgi:glycosyltransferase involved in cell wall biosynthesis